MITSSHSWEGPKGPRLPTQLTQKSSPFLPSPHELEPFLSACTTPTSPLCLQAKPGNTERGGLP